MWPSYSLFPSSQDQYLSKSKIILESRDLVKKVKTSSSLQGVSFYERIETERASERAYRNVVEPLYPRATIYNRESYTLVLSRSLKVSLLEERQSQAAERQRHLLSFEDFSPGS